MTQDLKLSRQERVLSRHQLDRVRAAAALLLPGSAGSPAPELISDFDELLQCAASAVEGGGRVLAEAIEALPADPSWEALSAFAERDPSSFELVSLVSVGAYFMSPEVLTSLGRPTGARRAAHPEQVVDELGTGLLDPVFERGCPVKTLDEVRNAAGHQTEPRSDGGNMDGVRE